MRQVFWISVIAYFSTVLSKKVNVDRVFKDAAFANFLHSEFNYATFLQKADYTAEKYVPFQDTSNDTYFRVGLLHKNQLKNYTKIRMADQLGTLKNKPWMPVNRIKEEFANCALFKYGSLSEQDFKYDKGMYGWMNIMKFSCTLLNDKFLVFAMAFTRTRFRLKQVYLRRQNKFWATSGRSLITRDVQKITEIFTIRFAEFVSGKVKEEFNKHGIENLAALDENPLDLNNDTFDELTVMYGRLRKHERLSESRGHTFSTLAIKVKSRMILTAPKHATEVVEAISEELDDAPLTVLDTCHKDICTFDQMNNGTFNAKTETHAYLKENAFINTVHPRYALIAYQTSKPYFVLETMKKRTVGKIVDVKQHVDEKVKRLWGDLLEQQFALAMHAHNIGFFPFERQRVQKYGFQ